MSTRAPILVVEDDAAIRDLVRAFPTAQGYDLLVAPRGAAAFWLPIALMSAACNQPPPGTCPYDGFLAKPFKVETLVQLVQQLAPGRAGAA